MKEMNSLNRIAWKRFKKERLSFFSFLFICILIFLGIFSYVFMSDKTPMANESHIEISTLPPGEKVQILQIPKDNVKESSFLTKIFLGSPSKYTSIPIASYIKKSDKILYKKYDDDELILLKKKDYKIVKRTYILGTDKYGRDMYSRVLCGIRVSLSVGFIAVIISLIIGISLGCISGFYGGFIDNIIMWLINVVWSIPTLLMVIAITLALGKGFWQIFVAVGLTMWVEVARVIRGQVIAQKNHEYVESGKVLAFSDFRIIFKHILPNVLGPVIVISAANFASAILIESGLSFLGLGAQHPIPSWGNMIKDHYSYIIMDKAYLAIIPGMAIMVSVLSFVLLGNGLRNILDVKQ